MARRFGNTREEIAEVRSRLSQNHWDIVSFDVHNRLEVLGQLIGTETGSELHRHVIVGSIAALETFHRGTIISIVDAGEEYKTRAAEKITEKISVKDALNWMNDKTVTFSELVAHSAPCNSVKDLLSWLETLLNCDIKSVLAEAIDPYALRNGTESPVLVSDVDALLKDLSEAFRFRHIFAHEAAPTVEITADECRKLHSALRLWIKAVDAVLWATAYRNEPLTQYEMNMHSRDEIIKARSNLAKAMRKALTDAKKVGTASSLIKNHFAWKRAIYDWYKMTYGSLDGTMWPSIAGNDLVIAIEARAEQVKMWNSWQDLEEPAD